MYGYIYITTNKINGKIYIGQHKGTCFDKKYYGSGKLLKKALEKYGKENFTINILAKAETEQELADLEIFYIKKYNAAKSIIGYNMSDGGKVPRLSGSNNGNYNHRWTQEMRMKMSIMKKKENLKPETLMKMSLARKGKYLSGDNNKAHAVVKLSKDNILIAEYKTLRDGAKALEKELNFKKTASSIEYNICATCRHKQNTSYGYKWMYKEEYLEKLCRKEL